MDATLVYLCTLLPSEILYLLLCKYVTVQMFVHLFDQNT